MKMVCVFEEENISDSKEMMNTFWNEWMSEHGNWTAAKELFLGFQNEKKIPDWNVEINTSHLLKLTISLNPEQ